MGDCSQNAWRVPAEREEGVLYMHGQPGIDYAAVTAIEVDGNKFIRSTGIENDMFFILPKPKERIAHYGHIERVEDDGSLKMYQSVQLVDEALRRWQGQIDDEIQRRLFETFAKPQEDESGAYVMVDGQRFERVRECVLDPSFIEPSRLDFMQEYLCSECGEYSYMQTACDGDGVNYCSICGAIVKDVNKW